MTRVAKPLSCANGPVLYGRGAGLGVIAGGVGLGLELGSVPLGDTVPPGLAPALGFTIGLVACPVVPVFPVFDVPAVPELPEVEVCADKV